MPDIPTVVAIEVAPLVERLDELERRLDAIENPRVIEPPLDPPPAPVPPWMAPPTS